MGASQFLCGISLRGEVGAPPSTSPDVCPAQALHSARPAAEKWMKRVPGRRNTLPISPDLVRDLPIYRCCSARRTCSSYFLQSADCSPPDFIQPLLLFEEQR